MKKLTNNTSLGKLILLCNVVVLVLFIISMLFLMKFDKTNRAVIQERNHYNNLYEQYATAQHPLRQDSAEVAYYQYKLDTLQQKTPANKDERKALSESIEVTKQTLADKKKQQEEHLKSLAELEQEYTPAVENWENLNADNAAAKKKFWVIAALTIAAFLIKTFLFAIWGAKNNKNLHAIAPWMQSGMKPWMSYVAWFVPIYNLIKPLSFFKEVWNETDYALENVGAAERNENKVDNSNIYMSIWWAFLLCSVWLMNYILFCTFFREGALYVKANHGTMVVVAIVIMVICMVIESALILKYNKKNLQLIENEDKF
jgi:ABC-type multidrug transport system fused ATPase/permease subunit